MPEESILQILHEVRADERNWLSNHVPSWKANPFTIGEISDPMLFTGYGNELKRFIGYIDRKNSVLISGSVGIGKTSLIKYVLNGLPSDQFKSIYIARPPIGMKDFLIEVLRSISIEPEPGLSTLKLFRKVIEILDDAADDDINVIVVIDELGEARTQILQWIRTLIDSADFTLVASGPPETIDLIKSKHFPLADRITKNVKLTGFSKQEVFHFLNKRVRFACTQSDFNQGTRGECSLSETDDCSLCISPFTRDAIDEIYSISGGTPREILKQCDSLLQDAIIDDKHTIDIDDVIEYHKEKNQAVFGKLTELQQKIVRYLFKEKQANSKQISNEISSPVNSTLNQLNDLMLLKVVERSGKPRGYEYRLTPEMNRYLQKGV